MLLKTTKKPNKKKSHLRKYYYITTKGNITLDKTKRIFQYTILKTAYKTKFSFISK